MLVARRLAGAENPSRQTVSYLGYTTLACGAASIMTHHVVDFTEELEFPEVEIITPSRFLGRKGDLWQR